MLVKWRLNQQNLMTFPMLNASGAEVPGLGSALTIVINKGTSAFAPASGSWGEIGNGIYYYLSTAAEADTYGPGMVIVTASGCVQQNLPFFIEDLVVGAIAFTYTVLDPSSNPIEDVLVWITTDVGGINVVWVGQTDAFGIARDVNGFLPRLDAGTYYFWCHKTGYSFVNPDVEVVS